MNSLIEYLKRPIRFYKKNWSKSEDFISSFIAGLFSGGMVGVLIKLTTDTKFDGWITHSAKGRQLLGEIFSLIIYIIFFLFFSTILYFIGITVIRFLNKKKALGFHLNYIAGMYSTFLSFLFVTYLDNTSFLITLMVIAIILFFPLTYIAIKKKHEK